MVILITTTTYYTFHRYFTDILNMLQGVYVFLIFVCKRNVYEVLFGTKGPKEEVEMTEKKALLQHDNGDELDGKKQTRRSSSSSTEGGEGGGVQSKNNADQQRKTD